MTTTLTMDKAGRVVLPKPVREALQLAPGDTLEAVSSEDQIVLRPVRGAVALRKKQGIWVYRAGDALAAEDADRTLRQVREERDRLVAGKTR